MLQRQPVLLVTKTGRNIRTFILSSVDSTARGNLHGLQLYMMKCVRVLLGLHYVYALADLSLQGEGNLNPLMLNMSLIITSFMLRSSEELECRLQNKQTDSNSIADTS